MLQRKKEAPSCEKVVNCEPESKTTTTRHVKMADIKKSSYNYCAHNFLHVAGWGGEGRSLKNIIDVIHLSSNNDEQKSNILKLILILKLKNGSENAGQSSSGCCCTTGLRETFSSRKTAKLFKNGNKNI